MTMRPVPEFPNYKITRDGKLYSVKTKRFIKEKTGLKKYPRYALYRDGKRFHKWIHRLVCEIWVASCEGLQVHHLDANPFNYHASNLVPLTPEDHLKATLKLRAKLAKQRADALKVGCPF